MTPAPGSHDVAQATILHATAVARRGRGCVLLGAAGSGKTSLALQMIALGAELIADDRVAVRHAASGPVLGPVLGPVPHLAGLIEIRGAGMLKLPSHAEDVPLWLAADLDSTASERMPPRREIELAGIAVPVLACGGWSGAAAALTAILTAGVLPDPEYFPREGA